MLDAGEGLEASLLQFPASMHPRGGRGGRLGPPRSGGSQQEYQMDPQREKAMRSIFGKDYKSLFIDSDYPVPFWCSCQHSV